MGSQGTLERCRSDLGANQELAPEARALIDDRLTAVLAALEAAPESRRWK